MLIPRLISFSVSWQLRQEEGTSCKHTLHILFYHCLAHALGVRILAAIYPRSSSVEQRTIKFGGRGFDSRRDRRFFFCLVRSRISLLGQMLNLYTANYDLHLSCFCVATKSLNLYHNVQTQTSCTVYPSICTDKGLMLFTTTRIYLNNRS